MNCEHCVPCALQDIRSTLIRMEAAMATEAEQLNTVMTKIADVHADVRARLDQVRAEVGPEGQAQLDQINEALSRFDEEVGDADGSDTATPA